MSHLTRVMQSILISEPLLRIKEQLYDACGICLANLKVESADYAACTFLLNGKVIKHRASKITPKKVGQFVAIWKRNTAGITAPYDDSDNFDFMIITSQSHDRIGQFIFPKSVLVMNGVVSVDQKGGKRGMRVYPPWVAVTSKQAEKTQQWQVKYFVEVTENHTLNGIFLNSLLI